MAPDAKRLWTEVYPKLREDRPGLVGSMTARGESVVLRLSLIYALLDKSATISREHIKAALAVWQYNLESVALIFQDKTGNSVADRVLRLLDSKPMRLTEFYKHLSEPAENIREALDWLEQSGQVRQCQIKQKRGRPATQWERVEKGKPLKRIK